MVKTKIWTSTHLTVVTGFQTFKRYFLLQITQNDPIRENEWFSAIFIYFSFTVGHQGSRLSHFSTILQDEVLVDFSDFGWLDMLHIAYSDSTNCSTPLDNQ